MKEIIINSRRNGQFVIKIDDDDFDKVNNLRWCISRCNNVFYATLTKKPRIHLHRFLMGCVNGTKVLIDHRDRNTLNNQKSNLRIATRSQNNANRTGRGYSKYLGVFLHTDIKNAKKWYSKINTEDTRVHLGSFFTEEEAALAYNKKAFEVYGEFANLNIIETATDVHSDRD